MQRSINKREGNNESSTYNISRLLVNELACDEQNVLEFYTNDINPCLGCFTCITKDEHLCPHRKLIEPIITAIESADVVIAASPNYCMGMTGQMKMFFDHLAYRWMSHRPHPSMKKKIGVAISTTAGLGAGRVTKSIATQMFWWGIARIYRIPVVVSGMSWDEVKAEKKKRIGKTIAKVAKKIKSSVGKVKPGIKSNLCFALMTSQHKNMTWNPMEKKYWQDNGWI